MRSWLLLCLVALISDFLVQEVASQGLFPLFNAFNMNPQSRANALPPKKRKGRPPNQKLKACCATLHQADGECKQRFCDFSALSSNTVSHHMALMCTLPLCVGTLLHGDVRTAWPHRGTDVGLCVVKSRPQDVLSREGRPTCVHGLLRDHARRANRLLQVSRVSERLRQNPRLLHLLSRGPPESQRPALTRNTFEPTPESLAAVRFITYLLSG